ncbi:MAG TPA: type II toxin-antitoxin system RelE/ParE family toxin [Stellaceae bacterium]|nr:type II toxin-antitoxin system RelE/ParE family toxin [Stellaceae bacterium]
MLPIHFLPEAESELREAQGWYDLRTGGLGERFMAAIDAAVARIGENPEQFPVVYRHFRRALAKRFPYALYFRVQADGIYVVACAHTSRHPARWRRRR